MKKIKIILNLWRLYPCFLIFKKYNYLYSTDLHIYQSKFGRFKEVATQNLFFEVFMQYPEFRSLFYYRLSQIQPITSKVLTYISNKQTALYIHCPQIGKGLFLEHAFSTIITAKSIGENCHINQQVTIDSGIRGEATIGNNVTVYAGAKIIGNIHIGNNVVIGANAVVVKNVPDNCTVVGVPAYIIKRNGIKTYEKL